ncbi:CotH kinase family protein [Olivibacter ginsenosidimutans]|uniref:CotH kinase family protein n=1 Tax=Olivibacter ginsenosidimutans TaxID=1176537 RepID=A0ABP9CCV1_9SPHI
MKLKFAFHLWGIWAISFALLMGCKKDREQTDIDLSAEHELSSFIFKQVNNPALRMDIDGEIIGDTVFAHTLVGTDLSTLVPTFVHTGVGVTVEGVEQHSDTSEQNFTQLVHYSIAAENGDTHTYVIKFSDTGLPAVYIATGGKSIDSKEDYVDGQLKITKGLAGEVLFEGALEIKGRGNSTWGMPKKPYKVKLHDKAALLGMPADKNWALMANYGDQSLLRNDVAFELSRRLELEYTPRQQYVELFLNGEYMGNYNLTEHVKEGKNRVPIDEDNGGFIVEEDGYAHQEPTYFDTPKGMPITVKFPDEDDITSAQFDYIKNYYTAFESSLFGEDFSDASKGYQQYFDLASFVNYYLVSEICGNTDMFWSMRMYKKSSQDPKIYTGPVWDFDLGFNNDKRVGNTIDDARKKLMLTDAHWPRQWIDRIMQDPAFKKLVRERWNSVKEDVKTIPLYVDAQAKHLKYSQGFNFKRWDVLGAQVNQSWFAGETYQEYVDFVRDYLSVRVDWLDEVINGEQFD